MGEVIKYRIAVLAQQLDALYKERAELQVKVKASQPGMEDAPRLLAIQQEISAVTDETKLLRSLRD